MGKLNNKIKELKMKDILIELPKESYSKSELIDNNLILLGDSLTILPHIQTKFDACVTDPPYNISGYDYKKEIGWLKTNNHWTSEKKFNKINEKWDSFSNGEYEKFTSNWLENICKIVKENGNIFVFGTYHNIYKIASILEKMNKRIITFIVWYKRNAFPNITQRMLCESTEYILWAVNNSQKDAKNWTFNYEISKKINNGKQMRNVWDIPMTPISEKNNGKHPTQKPKEILRRIILGFTNENEKVIDPFMGSGTTLLVCAENKRKCLGIDNKEEYFILTKKRLAQKIL